MQAFTKLTAIAAPLLHNDVDTDIIIRVDHMVGKSDGDLGVWAFASLRYLSDGREDPDFILNKIPYRSAQILLAGKNFGCGSSREPAVTALQDMGFRCVIAESFGDIFRGNCIKRGLLPITISAQRIGEITDWLTADPALNRITVDLQTCAIQLTDHAQFEFEIDPRSRHMLLEGLDEIRVTLQLTAEIEQHEYQDRVARPWVWMLS